MALPPRQGGGRPSLTRSQLIGAVPEYLGIPASQMPSTQPAFRAQVQLLMALGSIQTLLPFAKEPCMSFMHSPGKFWVGKDGRRGEFYADSLPALATASSSRGNGLPCGLSSGLSRLDMPSQALEMISALVQSPPLRANCFAAFRRLSRTTPSSYDECTTGTDRQTPQRLPLGFCHGCVHSPITSCTYLVVATCPDACL